MSLEDRKKEYKDFLKENENVSIFSQDWWLDAVCGEENWDVSLVKRDNKVIGSFPFFLKQKYSLFKIITQPPLTQTLEPLIKVTGNPKSIFDYKTRILSELIKQLPRTIACRFNLSHKYQNWLPFYWEGYYQTTYYSYFLDSLDDEEQLWQGLSGGRRGDIRKAIKNKLMIQEDIEISEFYSLYEKTYKRKGLKPTVSKQLIDRVYSACKLKNVGKILAVVNEEGNLVSGAYIIWDNETAYYLLGGLNPDIEGRGSQSYVIWEAIKLSSKVSKRFDFEGSMNKGIEFFFRSFGSKQQPYMGVQKFSPKLLKILFI